MNHSNYPEPDIPVDEAWASMGKLLLNTPAPLPSAAHTGVSKIFLYAGSGLIITALLLYFFVREKSIPATAATIYYSTNKPQRDTLPDGTVAYLDTHSSITVDTKAGKEESITVKGAVYFEDSKQNSQQPLRIHIGSVEAFPGQAGMYVSYDSASGISSVHVQSGNAVIKVSGQTLALAEGEAVVYDERRKHISHKQKADVNLFSYATKIFEFNNTPLKAVAACVEKAYGVQILFENKQLNTCRITTRFDNKSLQEILDILGYTLNVEYLIDEKNNQVLLTGHGCE